MNLSDFDITSYSGLYISKDSHPRFGKKYIARFQYDKKRYVKVLGYEKRDKLTLDGANRLMENFKDSILKDVKQNIKITQKATKDNSSVNKNSFSEEIKKLKEENEFFKSILKNYKSIQPEILEEGIQKIYDLQELKPYQIELIKLQDWLEKENKRMIIIFEGRDASGKGGAIRRITRYMNNKHYRVVALGKPTETQRNQWFMQKYIEHFPTGGEIVLFDRSWYNRAMVEPVFGFCTPEEHEIFMEDIVNFEQDLVRQGMILIKLYFSVSKEEQKRRFDRRINDPLRQWKFSEVDMQAQDLWDEFSEKKYEMLRRTTSRSAPWHIVRSDNKHLSRIEALKIILNSVDYDGRNYALNFEPNEEVNISVQKELLQMRKTKDY
ncbi:polyphosphate kinase 2 [Aliarcobacter skirrowii]|jgi:polyphosphate kinase 2|uniref:ADP/GDP-polyphosphate phosphotransferase n=3 Tax=Aliarcobacter skirrowii TaxID=28200 RepID=A0AAD0SNH7_9BACT|nr:polyphosphate kinase 2 [Aliarcobacter skirrowii]AXX85368.1 polyphosphate kinase 2 [Aliarcobacter skirrowii CCUG 10374]KAB0620100.1 polyphosphate kinase 2 [Aliarcobacter skirrowii CCUG 10374]RXI25167.1 polyphosphate kinase 2 [Aliarcobacter skirrowii CCUG 10374]SUU96098.1 polyphosphate kinase 2 [Aliarcobacter skirrowii]HAC70441.1 polyphosphate kinase 2 [Aliarcobacter skirrowii]